MSGRSGSPSQKATITSCPLRGQKNAPQFLPAQIWPTRNQHEQVRSSLLTRSQKNFPLTRPYLSRVTLLPSVTTTAVCTPWIRGLGVSRGGGYATDVGKH